VIYGLVPDGIAAVSSSGEPSCELRARCALARRCLDPLRFGRAYYLPLVGAVTRPRSRDWGSSGRVRLPVRMAGMARLPALLASGFVVGDRNAEWPTPPGGVGACEAGGTTTAYGGSRTRPIWRIPSVSGPVGERRMLNQPEISTRAGIEVTSAGVDHPNETVPVTDGAGVALLDVIVQLPYCFVPPAGYLDGCLSSYEEYAFPRFCSTSIDFRKLRGCLGCTKWTR
jgi:hypothetical protein